MKKIHLNFYFRYFKDGSKTSLAKCVLCFKIGSSLSRDIILVNEYLQNLKTLFLIIDIYYSIIGYICETLCFFFVYKHGASFILRVEKIYTRTWQWVPCEVSQPRTPALS